MAVDGFARALGFAAATAEALEETKNELNAVKTTYSTKVELNALKEELLAAIEISLGAIQADLGAAKAELAELTNLEEGEVE